MMKRLKSPKLFVAAVLGAALYFALAGGRHTVLDARRANEELEERHAAISDARRRIDSLEARIVELRTEDEMLERIAREHGFIRDGEYLYKVAVP